MTLRAQLWIRRFYRLDDTVVIKDPSLKELFAVHPAPWRTILPQVGIHRHTNPYKSIASFFMYLRAQTMLSVRCEVLCYTLGGRFDSHLPPHCRLIEAAMSGCGSARFEADYSKSDDNSPP